MTILFHTILMAWWLHSSKCWSVDFNVYCFTLPVHNPNGRFPCLTMLNVREENLPFINCVFQFLPYFQTVCFILSGVIFFFKELLLLGLNVTKQRCCSGMWTWALISAANNLKKIDVNIIVIYKQVKCYENYLYVQISFIKKTDRVSVMFFIAFSNFRIRRILWSKLPVNIKCIFNSKYCLL